MNFTSISLNLTKKHCLKQLKLFGKHVFAIVVILRICTRMEVTFSLSTFKKRVQIVGLDQGSYQRSEADWSPRIWLRVIQFPWDPVIARKYLGISVSTCQYGHPRWVIWRHIFKELCTKGKKKAVRKPQRYSEEIWAQQFMIKTLKLFSLKGRRERGRCVEKALCRKALAFQPGFQPPEATMKGALNFILFLLLISTGGSHWADMNWSQRPRERSRTVHVVSFSKLRTRWTADLKGREGTQHTRHNYDDLFYSVFLITCCIKQIIIF